MSTLILSQSLIRWEIFSKDSSHLVAHVKNCDFKIRMNLNFGVILLGCIESQLLVRS